MRSDWVDTYNTLSDPDYPDVEIKRFCLIHPGHLEHLTSIDFQLDREITLLQGNRNFNRVINTTTQCRSELIWNYKCPLSHPDGISLDHHFPYSLGGPTIGSNQIPLCNHHNKVKTNDIHFYSWENADLHYNNWLKDQINKMHRLFS